MKKSTLLNKFHPYAYRINQQDLLVEELEEQISDGVEKIREHIEAILD